ncbi:MAG: lipoyl(octanoyl) transferase LipB [Rickettsia sp.]|nr:lipoyl(octanoyl) transferase LipB [Rickettsia sp.]
MKIKFFLISKAVNYSEIIKFLETQVNLRIEEKICDSIYLLEHESVYTAGRSFDKSEILDPNIRIIKTNRGGKITYHGPGQRIIYPIISLDNKFYNKDLHKFIFSMEQWIINSLAQILVQAYKLENYVGIWTKYQYKDAKIASLGFRVKKWTIYHGISLNVEDKIENFSKIMPCGIKDLSITSIKKLGISIDYPELDQIFISQFQCLFPFYTKLEQTICTNLLL